MMAELAANGRLTVFRHFFDICEKWGF